MSSDSKIVIPYFIYQLITIIVFIWNSRNRNWKFVRITILYYFFITLFACLVCFGSNLEIQSYLDEWIKNGSIMNFPFRLEVAYPNKNTILRTNPSYLPILIYSISTITFPQAVNRATLILFDKTKSPRYITSKIIKFFNSIVKLYNKIQSSLHIVLPFTLQAINVSFVIGEWVFLLITVAAMGVSSHSRHTIYFGKIHDLNLMLTGCYSILFLTGIDIYYGRHNLIKSSDRQSHKLALKKIIKTLLKVIIVLICIYLFFYLPWQSNMFYMLQSILKFKYHEVILISIIISLILSWFSFKLLSKFSSKLLIFLNLILKVIMFPIVKLMEWMGIK